MTDTHIKPVNTPLTGAVVSGFLASACCIGPLIVVSLGLGSASMFVAMEPYRPLFATMTLALIGWAGWRHWQGRRACIANACSPRNPVRLWLLAGLAVLLLISPSLLPYLMT